MTSIGMILLIVGCIVIVIGWNTRPAGMKMVGVGVILTIAGAFIGIGGNPARDMPNGSPGMVALGFVLGGIGVAMLVAQIKKSAKNVKDKTIQVSNDKKISFYKECITNGVLTCTGEKETQKATLIADRMKLQFTDISQFFYECKELTAKDKEDKAREALNKKKKEEKYYQDRLNKYADYTGRDKRIAILNDDRLAALSSSKSLRDGSRALMNASQQKEHDWALHGGIASGIAGGAAGLAVASDIQQKNAQIRAQNDANMRAYAPVFLASASGASDYEEKAKSIAEEIEKTKTKLISKETAEDCLKLIHFSQSTVEVSETGTCTVTVKASVKQPFMIFDDVQAVIDGTIIAKIYDGETLIGAAQMVLPTYGLGNDVSLNGTCLYCGSKNKNYNVKYAAINLWAMER